MQMITIIMTGHQGYVPGVTDSEQGLIYSAWETGPRDTDRRKEGSIPQGIGTCKDMEDQNNREHEGTKD